MGGEITGLFDSGRTPGLGDGRTATLLVLLVRRLGWRQRQLARIR
jgi:hypothetical protein